MGLENNVENVPIFALNNPELKGKIAPFVGEPKFENMLISSSRWAEKVKLDTVSNINLFIKEKSAPFKSFSLITRLN